MLQLESDFEHLYEGKSMSLFAEWPALSAFIESRALKPVLDEIQPSLSPGMVLFHSLIFPLFIVLVYIIEFFVTFRGEESEDCASLGLLIQCCDFSKERQGQAMAAFTPRSRREHSTPC